MQNKNLRNFEHFGGSYYDARCMFLWQSCIAKIKRAHFADWVQGALLLLAFWIAATGFWRAQPRFWRALEWLDLQVYYLSARMLALDAPIYSVPARQTFGEQFGLDAMMYNYPPFFTALFAPLGVLPFQWTGYVWMALGLLALILSVWMLARALYLDIWKIIVLGLIALLMPATLSTFNVGQASLLLTVLFVSAMVVAPRPTGGIKNFAADALLGIASGMKVYPLLLSIPYLAQKRFNTLAVMGTVFAITLLAGIFVGGWGEAFLYWTEVLPRAGGLNLYPPNQSARAVIQRLFEPYSMSALRRGQVVTVELIPLLDARQWGTVLGWTVVFLILAVTLWTLLRRVRLLSARDAFLYNYALMIPAVMLMIPLSWDHYEPHLILPLAVVGLYKSAKPAPKILFGLACLLLALHRYWTAMLFEAPYAWLMMCGFLGTFTIWLALLWNPLPTNSNST